MKKKESRKERKAREYKERMRLYACGKYKYKNISGSDLVLHPKIPDGRKILPNEAVFIGGQGYQKLCPHPLILLEVLEEVPLEAPDAEAELEEVLPLGEEVKLERVPVAVKHEERAELTEELLRELRLEKKLSFPKIAKETGYSYSFIRKKCKDFNICG